MVYGDLELGAILGDRSIYFAGLMCTVAQKAACQYAPSRGPKDHVDIRILETMVSGSLLKPEPWIPCVYCGLWAPTHMGSPSSAPLLSTLQYASLKVPGTSSKGDVKTGPAVSTTAYQLLLVGERLLVPAARRGMILFNGGS